MRYTNVFSGDLRNNLTPKTSWESSARPVGGCANGIIQLCPLVQLQFTGRPADVGHIAFCRLVGDWPVRDGYHGVLAHGAGHRHGRFGDGESMAGPDVVRTVVRSAQQDCPEPGGQIGRIQVRSKRGAVAADFDRAASEGVADEVANGEMS